MLPAIVSCCIGCAMVNSQPTSQTKIPSWAKVSKAQIAEARKLDVPVAFANKAGIKFVLVPAGDFLMGSAEDEPGRYPVEAPSTRSRLESHSMWRSTR